MQSLNHIKNLIAEVGPMMNTIDSIKEYSGNSWSILFEEGVTVCLDYAESFNKVTFSALLDKPEGMDLQTFYEKMLTFNASFKETHGIRMALDGPAGNVIQLFDLSIADLDLQTLIALLTHFVSRSQFWMSALATRSAGGITHENSTGKNNALMTDMMNSGIRA